MWTVSNEFILSLQEGFAPVSRGEIRTDAGTFPVVLSPESTINVQRGNVRRTLTNCTLESEFLTDGELSEVINRDGAVIAITGGITWGGNSEETFPFFTGRFSSATRIAGVPGVRVDAADFGYDLAAITPFPPILQLKTMQRVDAIAELVEYALPGTTVRQLSSDQGILGGDQVWSGTIWEAIETIAVDGNLDVYFDAAGAFVIRDLERVEAEQYMFRTGDAGTIQGIELTRTLDRLYNTVIVEPGRTDASQSWEAQVAQITDPNHPRHPSKVGTRTLRIQSATVEGVAEARAVAAAQLRRVLGRSEQVTLQAVAMPALELGDRVSVSAILDDEITSVVHEVDQYSFDLGTWSMSLETRNVGSL